MRRSPGHARGSPPEDHPAEVDAGRGEARAQGRGREHPPHHRPRALRAARAGTRASASSANAIRTPGLHARRAKRPELPVVKHSSERYELAKLALLALSDQELGEIEQALPLIRRVVRLHDDRLT